MVRQRYPATGARNARVDLFVADLAAESRLQLDLGADQDIYLPRVDWFPDGRSIAVQRQSRDQKTLELLRFDALSGRGRVLLTERSEHWVPLHRELTFLKKGSQFIWASSRDGFQHLYLYGNDGTLIRQLTSGEFMVVGEWPEPAIRAVDERARRVYFTANLPSPIERQLFWVSLDAPGKPQRVTTGAGWHGIAMSMDARVFVDSYADVNTPRSVTLRTANGRPLSVMLANKLGRLASLCAVSRRARAGGVRHDRRRRRPGDALQTVEAAQSRARQTLPGARRCVRRTGRAARDQQLGQRCSISTSCSTATWCSRSTIAAADCAACASKPRSAGAWAPSKCRTR